ncbi:MAG: L,D-transpeptidase family protein [Candidatus Omnitrophica bacterium]|nr:L,D-transpeptidase family protein [Candidatus Omnitrophota bacterium]
MKQVLYGALAIQTFVLVFSISSLQAAENQAVSQSPDTSQTESLLLTDTISETEFSGSSSEPAGTDAISNETDQEVSGAGSSLGAYASGEVQTMIQNGELAASRALLLSQLQEATDVAAKEQIETDLSRIDTELLKSQEGFPGTAIYQVRSGDSLYVIARKHKTSVRLIQTINGLKSDLIHPGQKLKVLQGNFSISIDKTNNQMRIYLGEKFFKRYAVATGATADLTPAGTFTIVNKLENPTWYKTGVKPIAPGDPDNQLGTRWLGFSKTGFGIHGTTQPESIGQHATSGCVRMLNQDVEELYDLIPEGTTVTVVA